MKTLKDIKNLVGLDNHHNHADIFKSVKTILLERDMLRAERKILASPTLARYDEMRDTINGLKQLLELPESAGLTELFNAVEALELNKPQLSEIRYVLHGDIQPCSVLYSDDTTTLLRLDEGDIMCETDTIEWSDSVTYRCQELLKSVEVRSLGHVAPRLAQLVRDERILLNDNGDDVEYPKTVHIQVDNYSSESLTPDSIEVVDAEHVKTYRCQECNTLSNRTECNTCTDTER